MTAYYNEIDPYCVRWLHDCALNRLIPSGTIDARDIRDVKATDLGGYRQAHFFAGIGGFAFAAQLAGWPDDCELWTGGFPCQPFSVAGKRLGDQDDRALWPFLCALVAQRRPTWLLAENVVGIVPLALDRVLLDLENIDYAARPIIVPACAVDAPQRRERVWIIARNMADAGSERRQQISRCAHRHETAHGGRAAQTDHVAPSHGQSPSDAMEHAASVGRREGRSEPIVRRRWPATTRPSPWGRSEWVVGPDKKARRVESGVCLLAHGIPARISKLRAFGNAIVPQVAAEILMAMMEFDRPAAVG